MTIADLWAVLKRNPGSIVGLIILLAYLVFSVIGPMLYPPILNPDPAAIYLGPSLHHPLGTDYSGRDVLALVIIGTRAVIEVAVMAATLTVVIGGFVGLVSGFFGGWIDMLLMRITDIFLTVPGFPLLVLIASLTSLSNPFLVAVVLSLTSWGGLARAIRSQVLSFREREYIEAARSLRLGSMYIVFREVTPNLMPYIVMNLMLNITGAIYSEIGLFYLGVLPFNSTNWGVMLNLAYTTSGAIYSSKSILYLLSPMGAILLLQLGIIMVLRSADEIFNPRLRVS
jgi:peptide/nickel transport system permease protein